MCQVTHALPAEKHYRKPSENETLTLPARMKYKWKTGKMKWKSLCFQQIFFSLRFVLKMIYAPAKRKIKAYHYFVWNCFVHLSCCLQTLLVMFLWKSFYATNKAVFYHEKHKQKFQWNSWELSFSSFGLKWHRFSFRNIIVCMKFYESVLNFNNS